MSLVVYANKMYCRTLHLTLLTPSLETDAELLCGRSKLNELGLVVSCKNMGQGLHKRSR